MAENEDVQIEYLLKEFGGMVSVTDTCGHHVWPENRSWGRIDESPYRPEHLDVRREPLTAAEKLQLSRVFRAVRM